MNTITDKDGTCAPHTAQTDTTPEFWTCDTTICVATVKANLP